MTEHTNEKEAAVSRDRGTTDTSLYSGSCLIRQKQLEGASVLHGNSGKNNHRCAERIPGGILQTDSYKNPYADDRSEDKDLHENGQTQDQEPRDANHHQESVGIAPRKSSDASKMASSYRPAKDSCMYTENALKIPPGIIVRTASGRDSQGRKTPPRFRTITNDQLQIMRSKANDNRSVQMEPKDSISASLQQDSSPSAREKTARKETTGTQDGIGGGKTKSCSGRVTLKSLLEMEILRSNVTPNPTGNCSPLTVRCTKKISRSSQSDKEPLSLMMGTTSSSDHSKAHSEASGCPKTVPSISAQITGLLNSLLSQTLPPLTVEETSCKVRTGYRPTSSVCHPVSKQSQNNTERLDVSHSQADGSLHLLEETSDAHPRNSSQPDLPENVSANVKATVGDQHPIVRDIVQKFHSPCFPVEQSIKSSLTSHIPATPLGDGIYTTSNEDKATTDQMSKSGQIPESSSNNACVTEKSVSSTDTADSAVSDVADKTREVVSNVKITELQEFPRFCQAVGVEEEICSRKLDHNKPTDLDNLNWKQVDEKEIKTPEDKLPAEADSTKHGNTRPEVVVSGNAALPTAQPLAENVAPITEDKSQHTRQNVKASNGSKIKLFLTTNLNQKMTLQSQAATSKNTGQLIRSSNNLAGPAVFVAFTIPSKQKSAERPVMGSAIGSSTIILNSPKQKEISTPKPVKINNVPLTGQIDADAFNVWKSYVDKAFREKYGADCEYFMHNQWVSMTVAQKNPYVHQVRNCLRSRLEVQTPSSAKGSSSIRPGEVIIITAPKKHPAQPQVQRPINVTPSLVPSGCGQPIGGSPTMHKEKDMLLELYRRTGMENLSASFPMATDNGTFRKMMRNSKDVLTNPMQYFDFQFGQCLLSANRYDMDNWIAMKTSWRETPEWLVEFLVEFEIRRKKRRAAIDAGVMRRVAQMMAGGTEDDGGVEAGVGHQMEEKTHAGKKIQTEVMEEIPRNDSKKTVGVSNESIQVTELDRKSRRDSQVLIHVAPTRLSSQESTSENPGVQHNSPDQESCSLYKANDKSLPRKDTSAADSIQCEQSSKDVHLKIPMAASFPHCPEFPEIIGLMQTVGRTIKDGKHQDIPTNCLPALHDEKAHVNETPYIHAEEKPGMSPDKTTASANTATPVSMRSTSIPTSCANKTSTKGYCEGLRAECSDMTNDSSYQHLLGDLDLMNDDQLWNFQCSLFPPWQRLTSFIDTDAAEKFFKDLDEVTHAKAERTDYPNEEQASQQGAYVPSSSAENGTVEKRERDVEVGRCSVVNVTHTREADSQIISPSQYFDMPQEVKMSDDAVIEVDQVATVLVETKKDTTSQYDTLSSEIIGAQNINSLGREAEEDAAVSKLLEILAETDPQACDGSFADEMEIDGGFKEDPVHATHQDSYAVSCLPSTSVISPVELLETRKCDETLNKPGKLTPRDDKRCQGEVKPMIPIPTTSPCPTSSTEESVQENTSTDKSTETLKDHICDQAHSKTENREVNDNAELPASGHYTAMTSEDREHVAKLEMSKAKAAEVAKWHKEIRPIIELVNSSSSSSIEGGENQRNDLFDGCLPGVEVKGPRPISAPSDCGESSLNHATFTTEIATWRRESIDKSANLLPSKSSSSGEYVTADEIAEHLTSNLERKPSDNASEDTVAVSNIPELVSETSCFAPCSSTETEPNTDGSADLSKPRRRGGGKKRRKWTGLLHEPRGAKQCSSESSITSDSSPTLDFITGIKGKRKRGRKSASRNIKRCIQMEQCVIQIPNEGASTCTSKEVGAQCLPMLEGATPLGHLHDSVRVEEKSSGNGKADSGKQKSCATASEMADDEERGKWTASSSRLVRRSKRKKKSSQTSSSQTKIPNTRPQRGDMEVDSNKGRNDESEYVIKEKESGSLKIVMKRNRREDVNGVGIIAQWNSERSEKCTTKNTKSNMAAGLAPKTRSSERIKSLRRTGKHDRIPSGDKLER